MMKPILKDTKEIQLSKVEMEGAKDAYMAWLIDDRDAPVSFAMRIFRIKPGGRIPIHTHWYYHEIYCLEGEGRVKVGDEEFILRAGMVAYVPPDVPHSYENTGEKDWVFLCMIPLKKD